MTEFPPGNRDHQLQSDVGRGVSGRAFERHYTPKELAQLWNRDEDTIRRLFRHEPGVLCLESMNRRKGSRRYVSLSIPESVVARVHQRLEVPEVGAIKTRICAKQQTQSGADRKRATVERAPDAACDADELWEHQIQRTAAKLRKRALSNPANRASDP